MMQQPTFNMQARAWPGGGRMPCHPRRGRRRQASSSAAAAQPSLTPFPSPFPPTQLAAVRDVNALIDWTSSVALTSLADGPRRATEQWLRDREAVRHLLRSNLHHKQYCEQVERVLKALLAAGALRSEELDILWGALEKPDMHEEEKANVWGMLGALAADFAPEQLDALFARFGRAGRSAGDTVKLLEIARRLGRGDKEGLLCGRLLGVLWGLLRGGGAPAAEAEAADVVVELMQHAEAIGAPLKAGYALLAAESVAGPAAQAEPPQQGGEKLLVAPFVAGRVLARVAAAEELEAQRDPEKAPRAHRTSAAILEARLPGGPTPRLFSRNPRFQRAQAASRQLRGLLTSRCTGRPSLSLFPRLPRSAGLRLPRASWRTLSDTPSRPRPCSPRGHRHRATGAQPAGTLPRCWRERRGGPREKRN